MKCLLHLNASGWGSGKIFSNNKVVVFEGFVFNFLIRIMDALNESEKDFKAICIRSRIENGINLL